MVGHLCRTYIAFALSRYILNTCMAFASSLVLMTTSRMHVGEEMNRGLCKMLGEQVLLSGVYIAALLYGSDPIKALGYASLLWSVLLVDFLFFSKTYQLVGMHPARYLLYLGIACSFAYSCLKG